MLPFPPGARVKRTYQYIVLNVEPIKVLSYDPTRVLAIVTADTNTGTYPVFAHTPSEIVHSGTNYATSVSGVAFYGPQELWAAVGGSGSDGGAAMWVQQVFVT